ncbi:MAG: hypothetical protein AABW90_00410 [Nanoarchaeota archaeon]
MKYKNFIKEKLASIISSFSGTMGFLGGWQVCHNLCLGLIALLSVIGITLVGMPLLFLTKVAIPFWIAAVILFGVTLLFYFKKKCISKSLLLLNLGIIIAGVPFSQIQKFIIYFWIMGGTIITIGILIFIKDKYLNRYKINN